jgi:hypothetical protein
LYAASSREVLLIEVSPYLSDEYLEKLGKESNAGRGVRIGLLVCSSSIPDD